MMRDLLLACCFLLVAAGLVACSDPARTARRECDRVLRITQRTEVNLKRSVRTALLDVAKAEGQRRGVELKAAGCGPANATQPSSALIDPCKSIVAASETRYAAAAGKITVPAKKVDQAIAAVYASLLVVLDLLEDIDAGIKPGNWKVKLAALIAEAVRLYGDVLTAFESWRALVGVK